MGIHKRFAKDPGLQPDATRPSQMAVHDTNVESAWVLSVLFVPFRELTPRIVHCVTRSLDALIAMQAIPFVDFINLVRVAGLDSGDLLRLSCSQLRGKQDVSHQTDIRTACLGVHVREVLFNGRGLVALRNAQPADVSSGRLTYNPARSQKRFERWEDTGRVIGQRYHAGPPAEPFE